MDGLKFDNRNSEVSEDTSSNQGEKNIGEEYKCDFCAKIFDLKTNLNEHVLLLHNEEKNFVCSECQKAFVTAHNLKKHFERMHEDNKVRCDSCSKTFACQEYLKNYRVQAKSFEIGD